MLTSNLILSNAKHPELVIGIGTGKDRKKVELSAMEADRHGYGKVRIYDDASLMAEDLRSGTINAAVRGDLDSNEAMGAVREVFGIKKVLRSALLQPENGRMFFLAPVGIDEGWTVEEKIDLVRLNVQWVRSLGVEPIVGVMSGGRESDRGRMELVDRSMDDALKVVEVVRSEHINAHHAEILIENAAKECDIIIGPDGISGNLMFRTLHFLGNGKALGAPVLNIGHTYIDTSRAKASYIDSIALASCSAALRGRSHRSS